MARVKQLTVSLENLIAPSLQPTRPCALNDMRLNRFRNRLITDAVRALGRWTYDSRNKDHHEPA
jgi:hypothetical protein